MLPHATADIDIGSMLLEKKLITPDQLKNAVELQKIKGGYLSQRLIELNYVKDSDITTQLTCEFGFCYLPIKSYTISDDAIKTIPSEIACDYCVLPVEKSDKLLTIAMADPSSKGVIEILRQVSHCEIIVLISTRSEIKEAIEKYYAVRFRDFALDKFQTDAVLRDNLKTKRIANGLYSGTNRRRYKRLPIELLGEYYLYPNFVRTKIVNLSMSGLMFETATPLVPGTQLAINIHLDNYKFITAVIEIIRSENGVLDGGWDNTHPSFRTGAFFNFMSEENQDMLAGFLKAKITL